MKPQLPSHPNHTTEDVGSIVDFSSHGGYSSEIQTAEEGAQMSLELSGTIHFYKAGEKLPIEIKDGQLTVWNDVEAKIEPMKVGNIQFKKGMTIKSK